MLRNSKSKLNNYSLSGILLISTDNTILSNASDLAISGLVLLCIITLVAVFLAIYKIVEVLIKDKVIKQISKKNPLFKYTGYSIFLFSTEPGFVTNAYDVAFYGLTLLAIIALGWGIVTVYKILEVLVADKVVKQITKENPDVKFSVQEYLASNKIVEDGAIKKWFKRFGTQMTDYVPLEEERSILMDHDYDGIKELDNNLPPWWVYGFYLTIVIAVFYYGYNHFSAYGKSSQELYEIEMADAEKSVKAFLATQANKVDENSVKYLSDASSLAGGATIFQKHCVVCHLKSGGGSPQSVGPNLTDEYWLNGGGIRNIFKTIKYGVPEKGMISWESQLPPADMQKVSSYIWSLQGSNPENAKAPQGDLYVAEKEQ